jgi:hypothetical protein
LAAPFERTGHDRREGQLGEPDCGGPSLFPTDLVEVDTWTAARQHAVGVGGRAAVSNEHESRHAITLEGG